ncbi:hypothetical protein [Prosthecobacter sp.]|uniref:hypothetical protein n=1 Tax=Prosthecobacter sp. TaxID=1965333 RepID=UPI001DD4C309|nr:hypothetical protein [Prosthecobacter sp.]MCB1276792.1 hypothetical protein [Prosthecobacter sp.]
MNEDIKKDRSPSSPKLPLDEAIELVRKLHAKVGKASVKQEVAVGPLGYSGINGASLSIIAAITQYGLIDRERGGSLAVSSLALQLLHPTSKQNELNARRVAAKTPRIFAELLAGGFAHCDELVLTNHLIHGGFTPDGARKAAYVFKKNVDFASLVETGGDEEEMITSPAFQSPSESPPTVAAELPSVSSKPFVIPVTGRGGQLTELPIPLEDGVVARVPYPMSEESFDLLIGTLQLWKRKLVAHHDTPKAVEDNPP